MSKKEFHAFVCDSANGRVHSVSHNTVQARQLQAAMRQGSETARGLLLKMHATDEAATNQLANAGNISGLNAGTAGVSATVEGISPRQPGEGTEGDHDGKVQDGGVDGESLRTTISFVEQILAAVKAVAAKRGSAMDAGLANHIESAISILESAKSISFGMENTDQAGVAISNLMSAVSELQSLLAGCVSNVAEGLNPDGSNVVSEETIDNEAATLTGEQYDENDVHYSESATGMDEGAVLAEAANMLEKMDAQDAAFDVRSQRQRSDILNGLQSRGAIYAAGVRSAMDVKSGASQDAAEAAMRAAGIQITKRGQRELRG